MKKFMEGLLAMLVAIIVVAIILIFGLWIVTILLNNFLLQIGLHAASVWSVAGLIVVIHLIYKYIKW